MSDLAVASGEAAPDGGAGSGPAGEQTSHDEAGSGSPAGSERAAMELIFKVANATVGAMALEVASKNGGTPTASSAPPCTPQKQRKTGQKGRTPQTQTPLTWGSSS